MIEYVLPPGLEMRPFKDGSGSWAWRNGKPIRSVSRILERVYPMPPDLPAYFLERGKAVHHATTLIDAGTLDWNKLHPRLFPFCSAYRNFVGQYHPIVEASELTVVHPSYIFGARLDRIIRWSDEDNLVVLDIKTGMGKEDRYWCQIAACAIALDEANVENYDLALLNLDSRGKPHFTVALDPGRYIDMWRKILAEDVA